MPKYRGRRLDEFLDLTVMICGLTEDMMFVSAGGTADAAAKDWRVLMGLYSDFSQLDPSLLPSRYRRGESDVITVTLGAGLQPELLQPHVGTIKTCRCKVSVSRHPTLFEPMLRLRLFQTPW